MQDHFWYRIGEKPEKGADKRPGFKIRMASLIERGAFDAELEGRHGAAPVPPFIMLDTAIAGVNALLDEGEAAELGDLLRSFHGDAGQDRAEISAAERAQVAEIEAVLARSWPAYRQLVEQSARWRNLMPVLALQTFVEGWENVSAIDDGTPLAFERGKDGLIPDTVLRRLHPALIHAVGNRAYNFQYGVGEEKN